MSEDSLCWAAFTHFIMQHGTAAAEDKPVLSIAYHIVPQTQIRAVGVVAVGVLSSGVQGYRAPGLYLHCEN